MNIKKLTEIAFGRYFVEAVTEPLGLARARLAGSPAHSAVSSLGDLLVFATELLAPRILHPETLRDATSVAFPGLAGVVPGFGPQDPNDWGLGFELRDAKSPHWTGRAQLARDLRSFRPKRGLPVGGPRGTPGLRLPYGSGIPTRGRSVPGRSSPTRLRGMGEPMKLADGFVALVAGGTPSGRGIAVEALGAAGATVYVTGRSSRGSPSSMGRPETIEETAELVTAEGGRGIPGRVDHTVPAQVRALVDRLGAEQDGRRLDLLVNDIWGGDALTRWGASPSGSTRWKRGCTCSASACTPTS